MDTSMLSVGIDIGTSTTSMVVSRLNVQNTASCFTVPRVAITGAEIVYRGEIYQTPQAGGDRIDADAVAALLAEEYRRAGITPEQVQTGAVIITGESSRKENAALVTQRMSSLAGEFVVATAGPDLESIIAAKGAGTAQYSEEHGCAVANFDIGGGTTNIAVFRAGQLENKGCWDIGGRLIRVENGKISYVSPRVALVARELGITLRLGDRAEVETLRTITDRMAQILSEAAGLVPETPLCREVETIEATPMHLEQPADCLSFSGGVADYIYHPSSDWFRHGDIGPLLADSIRRSVLFTARKVIPVKETIRATVVGAGAYTTTVSGSTIDCVQESLLPLKNLPVFVPGKQTETEASLGRGDVLAKEVRWFLQESAADNVVFCLKRLKNPSYRQVCALADALAQAGGSLSEGVPLLVLTEQDYAKVLGQALRRRVKNRPVVCIDSIHAEEGDYLDLGRPLMGGLALPVVVKTLIFGE